ncbi:hypothetical protein HPB48_003127 [Haemaphysalis longicornis]|uniref:HTH CENPB-type domain-containing protein n=1 Tax=Haemaphysalis longicornis TaxID=44386 RepID=A0A9J6GZ52_HAELO|nr:hypothetical protein HPB48_003127 [Haemaphysalis longicornis]
MSTKTGGRRAGLVSNRLLQEQARKLASQAKLGNFIASSHYLSRWKKRFNVSLCAATNDSQKLPIDHSEVVSAFRRTVGTLHLQHDYSDFSIANMNQTMVQMDATRIANQQCRRGSKHPDCEHSMLRRGFTGGVVCDRGRD